MILDGRFGLLALAVRPSEVSAYQFFMSTGTFIGKGSGEEQIDWDAAYHVLVKEPLLFKSGSKILAKLLVVGETSGSIRIP